MGEQEDMGKCPATGLPFFKPDAARQEATLGNSPSGGVKGGRFSLPPYSTAPARAPREPRDPIPPAPAKKSKQRRQANRGR